MHQRPRRPGVLRLTLHPQARWLAVTLWKQGEGAAGAVEACRTEYVQRLHVIVTVFVAVFLTVNVTVFVPVTVTVCVCVCVHVYDCVCVCVFQQGPLPINRECGCGYSWASEPGTIIYGWLLPCGSGWQLACTSLNCRVCPSRQPY